MLYIEIGLFFLALLVVVVMGTWLTYSQRERGSKWQYLVPCAAITGLVAWVHFMPPSNPVTAFVFGASWFLFFSTGGVFIPRRLFGFGAHGLPRP